MIMNFLRLSPQILLLENMMSNGDHGLAIVPYDESKMRYSVVNTKAHPLESGLEIGSMFSDSATKGEQFLGQNLRKDSTKEYCEVLIPARNGLITKVKRKKGRPKGKQSPFPKRKDNNKDLPKCCDILKVAKDIII